MSTRGLHLAALVMSGIGVAFLVWHPHLSVPWIFVGYGLGIEAQRWFSRNSLFVIGAVLIAFGMGTSCTAAYLEPLPPDAARTAGVRVPEPGEVAQFQNWMHGGLAIAMTAAGIILSAPRLARDKKERVAA